MSNLVNLSFPGDYASRDPTNKENLSSISSTDIKTFSTPKIKRNFGTPLNSNLGETRSTSGLDTTSEQENCNTGETESLEPLTDAEPIGQRKKKRRERTTFTKSQLNSMQEVYRMTSYPDVSTREQLSRRIGVPESRIQVWFKNRRAKSRKDNKAPGVQTAEPTDVEYSMGQEKSMCFPYAERGIIPKGTSGFSYNGFNMDQVSVPNGHLPINLHMNSHRVFGISGYVHQANQIMNGENTSNFEPNQPPPHYGAVGNCPMPYPPQSYIFSPGSQGMYFLNNAMYPPSHLRCYPTMYNSQNHQQANSDQ